MTAVKFLKEKLTSIFVNDEGFNKLFEQAKEMEKKEHEKIYDHAFNYGVASSQTEISDEEIFYQKQVMNPYPSTKHVYTAWEKGFMECAKWYREQLKSKNIS